MLVTWRAEWGWDPSTPVRRDVDPRGVTWHYPGPGRFRFATHAECLRQVKSWDGQHRARGSNGLEYCWVVCQHGYFIEARSTWAQMIARPGSNGTTAANSVRVTGQFMAGTFDAPPSDQEYRWMGEATAHARSQGAGTIVDGHRDHYATACPGDALYANLGRIAAYAASPTVEDEDDMTPEESQKLNSIFDAIFAGGSSMPRGMSLAQLASGAFPVVRTVDGKDALIPTIQEIADGKTIGLRTERRVAAIEASLAAISDKVGAIGSGGLDEDAVVAKLVAAIGEALAGGTATPKA